LRGLRRIARRLAILAGHAGSSWRKLRVRMLYSGVQFARGVFLDRGVRIRTFDGGKIGIGGGTYIWRGAILEARGGEIRIGEHGLINVGCCLVSSSRIVIGDDALIAEYVTIRDQDHRFSDVSIPYREQGRSDAPISIGRNVWLGAKVTVIRGVIIGDDAIVGANSVVTRSLPAGGRYAGAPARPINSSRR
jgi:acetyltransferase-like isoleucine patch superfamily enzyme